ncbi:MAG: hypothetical protein IPH93_16070 [Saprospiraceae bacterium]|nr:hypothetical protein [Saprospiraceae bacterium]
MDPHLLPGQQPKQRPLFSLSTKQVFIGGNTNVDLPMTGSPFDGTRSGTDGFVAVFSKDLGTLHYSTYLGGTGAETWGVTSIKAMSDVTFVCALTPPAALPGAYVPVAAYDITHNGSDDMFIMKFGSSINACTWGTYIGGAQSDVINDIAFYPDGKIAFAGCGPRVL